MAGSSTQSTTIPEMSEQEKQLMNLITSALLPAYLDDAGYDVNTYDIPFEESSEGKNLKTKLDEAQGKVDRLRQGASVGGPGGGGGMSLAQAEGELNRIREEYDRAAEAYVPTTGYDVERRPSDAEISDSMRKKLKGVEDQYGKDSPEYEAALEQYSGDDQRAFQRDEIQRMYMDKVQKFLSGDMSVTPEQEKFIQDQYAPIKAAVDDMYTENMTELNKRYDNFLAEVDKTNMSVSQALDAVGAQIKETGANMEKALTSTVETNRKLMELGIEDATGQITKNISMAAISSGRDPSDPEYVNEIQTNIAREVERGNLQLTSMEAQAKLGIAERTGSGLEGVGQQKVALASATGSKKEGAILSKGQEEASLIQQKGSANIGIQEGVANLRRDLAMGLPTSQIGVGQGYQQLQAALAQQRLANASGSMSAVGYPYSLYSSERFAQPTTTTTQNMGVMDWLQIPMGVASAGASIYGGMATAGYMNAGADYLRSGV